MRKKSIIVFLSMLFLFGMAMAGTFCPAWADWEAVGTAGFSADRAEYPRIALDSNDTPYVVYRDAGNSYKATVMKFDGSNWQTVGTAGFSAGFADYTGIAFNSSDIPYVVYQDYGNSYKATVMQFNGSSWQTVGTAGFSAGDADYTNIAFDSSDTPYVVYTDYGNFYKATVMKFSGSSWQTVGAAGFSAGFADCTNIAFDSSDTPYVIYGDAGDSYKATVMKFDGSNWQTVGTAGFSAGLADYTNIVFNSSDTPFVVYQDDGNSYKTTVMQFNGSNWQTVGTAGFSSDFAFYTSIALDSSDTPYVVYRDDGNSYKATVMQFNGSNWQTVGTAGFSSDLALYTSIVIDSSDTPYVVYRDDGNSGKATVMHFIIPEIDLKQGGSPIADGGSYGFGDKTVGTDTDAVFTIENTGTADLTLTTPLTIDGADPGEFSIQAQPISPVTAGNSVTFTVRFSPSSTGAKTATISIGNNDSDENPYNMTITGTGTPIPAPEINLKQNTTNISDGGTHNFGSKTVGTDADAVFTIENTGTADLTLTTPLSIAGADPGEFSIQAQPTSPVTAGNSVTFTVRFSPSSTGAKTATISIGNNDSDENPYNLTITGTGTPIPAPEINLKQNTTNISDGGTYDFGSKTVGTDTDAVFTIENTGTADLTLTMPLFITGADAGEFSIQIQPTSPVTPGNVTTFTVRFSPASAGSKNAAISIACNDSDENPYDLTITGVGTLAPEINLKQNTTNISDGGTYNFGSKTVGTDTDAVFTIENTGTADLTLTTPLFITGTDAGEFSIQAQPTSPVTVGNTTTFTVRFSPASTGAKTATISIANNDSDENPYNLTITGTGTPIPAPEINLKQGATEIPTGTGSYYFGVIEIGDNVSASFTIENSGDWNLILSGTPRVKIGGDHAGDFAVTVQPGSPVAASGSTVFDIQFTPSALGTRNAIVTIANDDSDENPYTFLIRGAAPARILWNHSSGLVTLWQVDPLDEQWVSSKYYGPYPGWSAAGYFRQPDGLGGRFLWNHTAGTVSLWTLDTNDDWTGQKYFGPFAGWRAVHYYRLGDGSAGYLLWSHADGRASLWTLDGNDDWVSDKVYPAMSGWKAEAYYRNADGSQRRLLWSHADGRASLWTLDADDDWVSDKTYGPFPGWTIKNYYRSDNGDEGRLVWNNLFDQALIWILDTDDVFMNSVAHGPYDGGNWRVESYFFK